MMLPFGLVQIFFFYFQIHPFYHPPKPSIYPQKPKCSSLLSSAAAAATVMSTANLHPATASTYSRSESSLCHRAPASASGRRCYCVLPVPKSQPPQTCHLLHSEAQQRSVEVKNYKPPNTLSLPTTSDSQHESSSYHPWNPACLLQMPRCPTEHTICLRVCGMTRPPSATPDHQDQKKIKDVPVNTLFVIKLIICWTFFHCNDKTSECCCKIPKSR